jgi:hypothetical protein
MVARRVAPLPTLRSWWHFLTAHSSRLEAGLSPLTTMLLLDHLMSGTMGQNHRNKLPAWVWGVAFAAREASLQYNESMVPDDLSQAWERRDDEAGQHQLVLDLLKTCKPIEAHHFLHCVGNYEGLTAQFNVVLRRPDCDRATALMYFAYFWTNYYDGRPEWMDDEQHELMSYIRTRAGTGDIRSANLMFPSSHCTSLMKCEKFWWTTRIIPSVFLPTSWP